MTSAIFQTIWTDVSLKSDVCFRSLIIFTVNKIRCIATNLYCPNMVYFCLFFVCLCLFFVVVFCFLFCFFFFVFFFLVLRGSHFEKFVNI